MRRLAVELYTQGVAIAQIEKRSGVDRRQLYRLLERCGQMHDDGRVFGFRALVPYSRVGRYTRTRPFHSNGASVFGKAAGAFGVLLQTHPTLAAWISDQVRGKRVSLEQLGTDGRLRVRLRGLKHSHSGFLRECRKLGVTPSDYPFNTDRLAIRALARTLRAECLRTFERGAHLAGASHLKGLPRHAEAASALTSAPAASQFLELVEFDGHRLDLRLKIVVRDPLGFE